MPVAFAILFVLPPIKLAGHQKKVVAESRFDLKTEFILGRIKVILSITLDNSRAHINRTQGARRHAGL